MGRDLVLIRKPKGDMGTQAYSDTGDVCLMVMRTKSTKRGQMIARKSHFCANPRRHLTVPFKEGNCTKHNAAISHEKKRQAVSACLSSMNQV
jgi:hypothetical protein